MVLLTQLEIPNPELPTEPQPLPGFRLQRFEVLNWGTFHEQPWVVDLQGGIALLTGANGSGKSTLVDGLLTLLVPNQRRNYNKASSTTARKERNEKSYVQGAYGRTRAEDAYGSKPKLLREKGKLSVLLACFRDRVTETAVTLAQLLWIKDGSVHKFFVIADLALSIQADFMNCTRVSDLKRSLKAQGAEIFEQFRRYSQQFRKRLGLQSEKALDLFNQTVSIKEVGGLNSFVREHMLEKMNVQAKIEGLQESYENLTFSHTQILQARRQLEALAPLSAEAQNYEQLLQTLATITQQQAILPHFFADRKQTLLTTALQSLTRDLEQRQAEQADCDRRLGELQQQAIDLEVTIKQDSVGQRLQALKQEIQRAAAEVAQKRQQTQKYDDLAERLGLAAYGDRTTFYTARAQGETLQQEITDHLHQLQTQRDELKLQEAEGLKQREHLQTELDSLRSRKSQIPKRNLDIRDRLCADLGLDEADLPFVGELLQVRPEHQDWEGAIERLLRSFGLCVLVADADYRAVNAYVRQTHLRGRLVYFRVKPSDASPMQRAPKPDQVPYRLEIKQDEAFADWLHDRLNQQFNYVCCEDEAQFRHEPRALTQEGLLKHGQERHEKDDRSRISDRSTYILGWNNASKIAALEADLAQLEVQIQQTQQQITTLEKQQRQRNQQQSWLQDFMNVTDFATIDWRTTESERLELEHQKAELEASSDHLRELETQLQIVKADLTQVQKNRDRLLSDIRSLKDQHERYQKELQKCHAVLVDADMTAIQQFQAQLTPRLRRYDLSLATIDRAEIDLRDKLQDELRRQEKRQNESQNTLNIRMLNFKTAFPETVADLDTTLASLPEYLKLQAKIEYDDLPKHEKRFKELMNEKVIIAISMFKSALEKQEESIEEAVAQLNASLRGIDYTSATYIELCCDKNRDREIRDFQADLRICLGDVARQTAADNEERFENIQKRLIKRFKEEDRWTTKVTDVRNWLDFSVSERYRSDDSEKEHHTDSSGKSGGQKVKLAYTILASAIAYQFGLNQTRTAAKSFRFVVIDEAFSKSDDSNARYAMELFENLQLQLLVITPKDKINVIEPYIANLHFVANTPEGDYSSVASIGIADYRAKRQEALHDSEGK
ncbi:MAG: hypothetical protein F6J87_10045 [Spirulina sp. SIO3F2]|nr:hypothetical protein [Spirulina sp. SIO3F2]